MGQQKLLSIILGVIIVGTAIGCSMFSETRVQSNKNGIIKAMNNLSADVYHYRIRPTTEDGGGGSYIGGNGYLMPSKLASNENGTFTCTRSAQEVTIVGNSQQGYGTITAVCDSTGRLGNFTYTGQFR